MGAGMMLMEGRGGRELMDLVVDRPALSPTKILGQLRYLSLKQEGMEW